ncbi:MAG: MATE family efflux transporter [Oscillospiraceae bacterium]
MALLKKEKTEKPQEKANDLGKDSIGKLLFKLAVPAILAQLINALYNIVDRMYIGHIPDVGKDALTGVGVTFPILMIISAFACLIGMGGAPRVAIKLGEKKNDEAENILGNCFTALIAISVVLTVVFLFFGRDLLMAFGASEKTIPYALTYMNIYVCGTFFVQMALGLNSFISTQGFAKTAMYTVLIGAIANIVLDPIFIFVFDMGVSGAAIATVISQAISAIWVMKFLFSKKSKIRLRKKYFKPQAKMLLPVLALGISPFIMQSTESFVNIALNSSLKKFGGDDYVGAMTIIGSVMQFCMMPLSGLAMSAQPITSYNYGAKNIDRVKKTFKYLIITAVIFSVALWAAVMIVPQIFVKMFSSDEKLTEITVWAMRIFFAGILMIGPQIACQQTFVALGQATKSLGLALLRKVVLLIPLVYILPMFFANASGKLTGVFLAEPVADVLATTTTIIVFALSFNKILNKQAQP